MELPTAPVAATTTAAVAAATAALAATAVAVAVAVAAAAVALTSAHHRIHDVTYRRVAERGDELRRNQDPL